MTTTGKKLSIETAHDEPWCLVCGTIVKAGGVKIVGEGTEDVQNKFHAVLKAAVPKRPPSDVICKRCERTIRRVAGEKGEAAEREVEYLRKTYKKTVLEYNAKVEKRAQKLKKVTEAFMTTKLKPAENKTEKKVTIAATRWKLMAKAGAGSAATQLPVPVAPTNGETTPTGSADGGASEKGAENFDPTTEAKNPEKSPLVKHDSLEAVSPEEEVVNHVTSTEPEVEVATETESKMPFSFFKKKEPVEEKKPLEEMNAGKEGAPEAEAPLSNDVSSVPADNKGKDGDKESDSKKAESNAENNKGTEHAGAKDAEAEDGGSEKPVNGEVKIADEKIDGQVKTPPSNDVKKEDSPLITKESKVKDTGPGMLCCTIM